MVDTSTAPHQVSSALLRVENITKYFGNRVVLNAVSLSIEKGEILSLLGPNGAGKTTFIRCLLGLIQQDTGHIESAAKEKIGCALQEVDFPEAFTVRETLDFIAAHYENPSPTLDVMNRFFLAELQNRRTNQLSGGQKRCLGLACAFIGNAPLVILDEPTVALDIEVRMRVWQEIKSFAKGGGGVLFTSHYLEEAEALSDRVLLLHLGKIIRDGTPEQMKAEFGFHRVRFKSRNPFAWKDAKDIRVQDDSFEVITERPDDLVRHLVRECEFENLEVKPMSLEDAFWKIVGQSNQGLQ